MTEKLQKLNDLLSMLRGGESVSPYYLARLTKIPMATIIKILNSMVSRSMLDISFIIKCNNPDNDLIHGFEFEDEDDLLDFIRDKKNCPHCGLLLLTNEIKVFYKMKSEYIGDVFG